MVVYGNPELLGEKGDELSVRDMRIVLFSSICLIWLVDFHKPSEQDPHLVHSNVVEAVGQAQCGLVADGSHAGELHGDLRGSWGHWKTRISGGEGS
jgi:hypothetical protein